MNCQPPFSLREHIIQNSMICVSCLLRSYNWLRTISIHSSVQFFISIKTKSSSFQHLFVAFPALNESIDLVLFQQDALSPIRFSTCLQNRARVRTIYLHFILYSLRQLQITAHLTYTPLIKLGIFPLLLNYILCTHHFCVSHNGRW